MRRVWSYRSARPRPQKTRVEATVKRLFGISWVTVGRIAGRVVREKVDPERFKTLAFIGIDEFSYQRRHKYATIVMNHETGEPVWIGQGRSIATLEQFFDQIGSQGGQGRALGLEENSLGSSRPSFDSARRRERPRTRTSYSKPVFPRPPTE
jgi:hypothetical protein